MLQLWIVRHGETDWNTAGRVQGWTDVPLNDVGIDQATKLGEHLHGIPFRAIVSSDLARAHKTAKILQRFVGASISLDPQLRERTFGQGEGLLREEMHRRFPQGAPDEESMNDFLARAERFLDVAPTRFGFGRVLCVSHGGFIRAMLTVLGHRDIPALHNTSLHQLVHDGKRWTTALVNWSTHLSEKPVTKEDSI